MTTPTTTPPTTTPGASAVRLAVAQRSMASAETLHSVVAAKDKAKAGGLTARDTQQLKVSFEAAKARVIRTTLLERQAAAASTTTATTH